jgi:hypothetical protein
MASRFNDWQSGPQLEAVGYIRSKRIEEVDQSIDRLRVDFARRVEWCWFDRNDTFHGVSAANAHGLEQEEHNSPISRRIMALTLNSTRVLPRG